MGLNSSRKHFIACCKRQATSKHHMCSDFSLFAPHFCSVIIARRNKQGWGCHALAKMNLVWFLALVPKWPFHFPHQYENIPQNSGHRNFSIDNIVLFYFTRKPRKLQAVCMHAVVTCEGLRIRSKMWGTLSTLWEGLAILRGSRSTCCPSSPPSPLACTSALHPCCPPACGNMVMMTI